MSLLSLLLHPHSSGALNTGKNRAQIHSSRGELTPGGIGRPFAIHLFSQVLQMLRPLPPPPSFLLLPPFYLGFGGDGG